MATSWALDLIPSKVLFGLTGLQCEILKKKVNLEIGNEKNSLNKMIHLLQLTLNIIIDELKRI